MQGGGGRRQDMARRDLPSCRTMWRKHAPACGKRGMCPYAATLLGETSTCRDARQACGCVYMCVGPSAALLSTPPRSATHGCIHQHARHNMTRHDTRRRPIKAVKVACPSGHPLTHLRLHPPLHRVERVCHRARHRPRHAPSERVQAPEGGLVCVRACEEAGDPDRLVKGGSL